VEGTVKLKAASCRVLSTSAAKMSPWCPPGAKVELKVNHALPCHVLYCSASFLPSTQSSILRSDPKECEAALKLTVGPEETLGEQT